MPNPWPFKSRGGVVGETLTGYLWTYDGCSSVKLDGALLR